MTTGIHDDAGRWKVRERPRDGAQTISVKVEPPKPVMILKGRPPNVGLRSAGRLLRLARVLTIRIEIVVLSEVLANDGKDWYHETDRLGQSSSARSDVRRHTSFFPNDRFGVSLAVFDVTITVPPGAAFAILNSLRIHNGCDDMCSGCLCGSDHI